jgi:hypothetical protein
LYVLVLGYRNIHVGGVGRIRTKHVINPSASVAPGFRALTCLSLLRFRKGKKPNYFDNYSVFADSKALSVPGGLKLRDRSRRKCLSARIAL